MKNWKTSLGGILAVVGTGLAQSAEPIMHFVGLVVNGLGTLLLALAAKDANVTGGTVQQ